MAFIAATTAGCPELQVRDLIWMTTLGAAAQASVTVDDVCRMAADLGGPSLSPGPGLVLDCIDEMLRGGHLRMGSPRLGPDTRIVTTAAGLETLALLALSSLPTAQSDIGQVARRVRTRFDDVLPPDLRLPFAAGMVMAGGPQAVLH